MKKFFTKSRITFVSIVILLMTLFFVVPIVIPQKAYVILTNSMVPVVDPGDLMVVDTRINIDELRVGQIIGFKADIDNSGEKKVVFHYIHSISNDESDNIVIKTIPAVSNVPDSWEIYEDDLVGAYVFHIAKIGKVMHFLKSPFGILFMFINVIVVFYVWDLFFKKKKPKEKKVKTEVENK